MQEKYSFFSSFFFFCFSASNLRVPQGLFLINEKQKKSARNLCDTLTTHARLVYDVTDADCMHKAAALTVVFLRLLNG